MNFGEYLIKKKIDKSEFQKADRQRFDEWERLFDLISEQSFTLQKLYLINQIRRKFPLVEENQAHKPTATSAKPKPIVKPKPKIN